jgi:hypothetical protein
MTATATSPKAHRERRVEGIVPERTVLGITLFGIGLVVLAGLFVGDLDRYTLVLVSAILLGAFALTREYGYAVPAGITGGVGAMVLLTSSIANDPLASGSAFFLCLAGGFAAVWLLGLVARPREIHPWPLVPATVLGFMGLAVASRNPSAIDWLVAAIAVVLIAGGSVMVLRHRQGNDSATEA